MKMEINMKDVLSVLERAQKKFHNLLLQVEDEGGLTHERYVRYLSMQYHLTKGVQRPFLTAAAHPDMGKRRGLRKFLVNFANEEEFHFQIAAEDLRQLGKEPLPMTLDVELWWAFFDRVIQERPFVRLGATCILENLTVGSKDIVQRLFSKATYLTPKNTIFFKIHSHEELPHGDQIIEALTSANLEERHFSDLVEGAEKGAILYLRMARWAFYGDATYDRE